MSEARFTVTVPDDLVTDLAQRLAQLLRVERAEDRSQARWMTVRQAAAYLASSEQAVRGLVKRRQLPVHRAPNGRLLFDARELDRWVRGEAS